MIQSSLLQSPWYFLLPRPHEDFREIGHTFEHTKVDSCHLLMPQRRERVWGSSCTGAHDTQYPLDMKITMQRLKGPKRFTLGDVLLDDLPTCDPPVSDSFQCQLEKVKNICQERKIDFSTVTMDSSTSRRRSPEYACDMFTCIRPSHRIWLCGHNRFAEPQELLRAHGVFAEEFHVPKAVLDLEPHLAADFAGNAFSTSALIAKILCTMVNGFRGKDWPTKCLCPAVVFSMNVLAELPRGPMNKGPRSHQWNPHPKKVKNREESLRSLHESVRNQPGSQKVIQKRPKLTRTISSGGRISRVPYSPSAKKWRFWSAIKSWQRQPSILRRLGSGWGLWNTYFPTKTVSFFTEQHADIVWMNILCICTASPTVSLTLSYLWLW